MLRAAIEAETGFALDDCELRRPPPSYAIDTVEEIRQRETNTEIHYLIGEDNVAALASWHRFN
jgi:nicotinate-nucleotide adenylyltransferase